MISDAYVRVTCDECDTEDEIQLTATSRGYDDRNLESDLKRLGYVAVDENTHHCPDCVAKLGGARWKGGQSCEL